jgi:hypothetical protein
VQKFPEGSEAADIVANLDQVRERIAAACARVGRCASEVRFLLVTKTIAPDQIRIAVEAGAELIGENKVQELVAKAEALRDLTCERHFIGHLQSNKIKQVLQHVSCIQSIDSLGLAEKLDRQLQKHGRGVDIFLQVNTSGEATKFGIAPGEALGLARQVARLGTLRVRGMMTIGMFNADGQITRRCFAQLRALRDLITAEGLAGVQLDHLSMGMSLDFEDAIAEGSTLIRVGRFVFGPRPSMIHHYWNETDSGA